MIAAAKRRAFARPEAQAALFLARWLKAPHRIGAVAPASRGLARAMVRQIDLNAAEPVIELGGGTDSITRALLEAGLDPTRLIVVEHDRRLHALLQARFPGLRALRGDAAQLRALLAPLGIARASAVVSRPAAAVDAEATTRPHPRGERGPAGSAGLPVQYTYGLVSPLARRDFGLTDARSPRGSGATCRPQWSGAFIGRRRLAPRLSTP
jgi:phosphatidylethanolamine/phosphatidyl-N-methylethanolamine N-methyltransferase